MGKRSIPRSRRQLFNFLSGKKSRGRGRRSSHPSLMSILPVLLLTVCSWGSVFYFLSALSTSAEPLPIIEIPPDPNSEVELYVRAFLAENGAEALVPIIACESDFRHYETDGSPLKNREGSSAIGVAQILASKHPDPKAISRYNRRFETNYTANDFDINTLEGNLKYALLLYELRGIRDWECAHYTNA